MTLKYSHDELELYASSLARVASLSNLFSESVTPFIHYRATEYLYARTLNASNLARSDIAIDAKRGKVGVGLKTFVYNGKPKYEKIAEFNKEIESFDILGSEEKVRRIAFLRNERIDVAANLTDVDTFIYHCIARLPGKLFVFEVPMPYIQIDNIKITKIKGRTISFIDGLDKYRFNSSKSTLYKEFYSIESLFEKPVVIYKDPFELLSSLDFDEKPIEIGAGLSKIPQRGFVALPLYGYTDRTNRVPFVFEKSGLNQWNAGGRDRNLSEVYIPVPSEVHQKYPGFLPSRNQPFELHFPDGKVRTVKVCQENDKALMSEHNADMGEWLLRDVLKVKEGKLLTYKILQEAGIDSVQISKEDDKYYIDFKKPGFYEKFINS